MRSRHALMFLCVTLVVGWTGDALAQAPPLIADPPDIEENDEPDTGEQGEPGDAEAIDGDAFDPIEYFILPLAGYTSDVGFAGALLAMVFHYEQGIEPYRDKVQVIATLTTRLVQYHQLVWERVQIFGLPLRIETSLTFAATPVGHYCGLGNQASCDRLAAVDAARQSGLRPGSPESDEFIENYYRFRVLRPSGSIALRWRPSSTPLEFQVRWVGDYGISGFVGSRGPYAGSLYAQDYPDGEAHLLSEIRTGVLYDTRDQERRASSGYLLSANLRVSASAIGSHWNFFGVNLAASHYTPLDQGERVIIANRAIVDTTFGDVPTTVMGSLGGFWSDVAFGGTQVGRGVRSRRFIGRIKLITQSEIRWAFMGEPDKFQLVFIAFGDVAWVGESASDFGGDPGHLLVSFGGGLTAYWGQNFILRFDVGLSPEEDYSPQFYINLLHPY